MDLEQAERLARHQRRSKIYDKETLAIGTSEGGNDTIPAVAAAEAWNSWPGGAAPPVLTGLAVEESAYDMTGRERQMRRRFIGKIWGSGWGGSTASSHGSSSETISRGNITRLPTQGMPSYVTMETEKT